MDQILFIATLFALLGAYFVSKGNYKGFSIWIVTNAIFAFNNWYIGQWQQSLLFSAYFFLACNGLKNFKKKQ